MKIALIGASGRSGHEFGTAALAAGHEVRAVVRDAARLRFAASDVATADARDADQLSRAVKGTDAVVFAAGPGPDAAHGIVTEGVTATISAMATAGIRRLVVISASGPFADGDNWLLGKVLKPVVQRILRAPFADIAAADAIVQASDTDWTIVRPPQLTDKPARGSYTRDPRFGMQITRGDLARALLDVLADDSTIRKVITVAN